MPEPWTSSRGDMPAKERAAPPKLRLDDGDLMQIVRVVRATLEAKAARESEAPWKRTLGFCLHYWVMLAFLTSVVLAISASVLYEADPFYKLKEVKVAGDKVKEQIDKSDFNTKMAKRYLSMGELFLDVWQMAEAEQAFTKALQLDSSLLDAETGRMKAQIFAASKSGAYDPEVIERRIALILEMSPDGKDAHAFTALGDMHSDLKDWPKAQSYYEQAKALRSSLARAHFGLGMIALKQQRHADAEAAFRRAVEISPNNCLYRANWADALARLGNGEAALREFGHVWRLDPDLPLPYVEAASIYRKRGSDTDLRAVLQIAEHIGKMFAQEKIAAVEKSRGEWIFDTRGGPVSVWGIEAKRAYVTFTFASMLFVLGDEQRGVREARSAPAVVDADAMGVAPVVDSDLKEIEAVRPDLISRIERLRMIFHDEKLLAQADAP